MYTATLPVVFDCSRADVYRALCDLGRYPEWNQGMISISFPGVMYEGLHYRTESLVAGHVNVAQIEVVKLVPDRLIRLASNSGLIAFEAAFELTDAARGTSEVVCRLNLELQNFMLVLARPVVEAMAQNRVTNDLEMLSALLSA